MTALILSANSIAARGENGRLSPQAINLILSQIGRWHDADLRPVLEEGVSQAEATASSPFRQVHLPL